MAKKLRGRGGVRLVWKAEEVERTVDVEMRRRVTVATALLHGRIVKNISKSVGRTGGRVTQRSRPGEFPRAETTQLMKTLFWDVKVMGKIINGFVGTPLDYGLILETSKRLNRSFLLRTLNETKAEIRGILARRIVR